MSTSGAKLLNTGRSGKTDETADIHSTKNDPRQAPAGHAGLLVCHTDSDSSITDPSVLEFVRTKTPPNDSTKANQIAQWCVDSGEPALFRAVTACGLVTELHLKTETATKTLAEGVIGSSSLENVLFVLELAADERDGRVMLSHFAFALGNNSTVRQISFASSGNRETDLKQIRPLLKNDLAQVPRLRLDLGSIVCDESVCAELAEQLKNNGSVEALTYDCRKSGKSFKLLAQALKQSPIEDLSFSNVDDSMLKHITEMLSESHALQSLQLVNATGAAHDGNFRKALSRNTSLVSLKLDESGAIMTKQLLELFSENKCPNIKSLTLPYIDPAETGSIPPKPLSRLLKANRTLVSLDVSQAGMPFTAVLNWVALNTDLRCLTVNGYVWAGDNIKKYLHEFSNNHHLTEIHFRPTKELHPPMTTLRELTTQERAQFKAAAGHNKRQLDLKFNDGFFGGAGKGLLASIRLDGKDLPADPGEGIGLHAAHNDARDGHALSVVSKATAANAEYGRSVHNGGKLSTHIENSRFRQAMSQCIDMAALNLTIQPAEARQLAKHLAGLLGYAVRNDSLASLLPALAKIGIPFELLRRPLEGLQCEPSLVLDALRKSTFKLGKRDHLAGFFTAPYPSATSPAAQLFIDYNVILRKTNQARDAEHACIELRLPELLLALAHRLKRRHLSFDCGSTDMVRVAAKLPSCTTLTSITLTGSLDDAEAPAVMGWVAQSSSKLETLELSARCSEEAFRKIMVGVSANSQVTQLVVWKWDVEGVESWCQAIGQALQNDDLQVTLNMPAEMQRLQVVRDLVAQGKGRVSVTGLT